MTDIPDRRHSASELNRLRMQNVFAVRPPVQRVKNMALHPVFLGVVYLLCLASLGLLGGRFFVPSLVCSAVVLVAAVLFAIKKPRSRHHATILAIISLLVLVFGTVYYQKQFEQTANDAQGPIRY